MTGTDPASGVPNRWDLVIDGHGYIIWRALLQNLPFRYQRAAYSYTKTFIERLGTSGPYGDDDQAFFLTTSQSDWSEGEGQRFYRGADKDRSRQFWAGYGVDPVTVPGQVTMTRGILPLSPAADIIAACPIPGTPGGAAHAITSTSTLYFVSVGGSITTIGAHGAGTPRTWGMTRDSARSPKVYIAGASKIRLYDANAGSFSDFSASADVGSLAFLNNALYSCDGSTLNTYDSSGNQTTLFTWKDAKGVALAVNTDPVKLLPFGGDLLIFFPQLNGRPQLWMYDGTSTSVVVELPSSAIGYDAVVLNGIVFLSGTIMERNPFSPQTADAALGIIWFYINNSLNELWRAKLPASSAGPAAQLTTNPALGTYSGRLIFFDASAGLLFNGLTGYAALKQYDIDLGAVSTIGVFSGPTSTGGTVQFSSTVHSTLLTFTGAYAGADSAFMYPDTASLSSTGSVLVSSAIDFDNSLAKVFRSVRLDWEGGSSVDIAYAVDQIVTAAAGSWTTLQTGAVSGTEYLLPAGTIGHELMVKLALNLPVSGAPPTLKRMYVRAVPVQQTYRRVQYVIDLTGRLDRGEESNPVVLQDGTYSTLTGAQMAANLVAAITATSPISVTDRFGTFNAVFEQGEGITEIDEVRPAEFVAQVTLREV